MIKGAYTGLDEREIANIRRESGSNELTVRSQGGFFSKLAESFSDPIIKILIVALAINIVLDIGSGSYIESLGIAAALLISTLISTVSEYSSELAFRRMQLEAGRIMCSVIRSGNESSIPIGELVRGDIVVLHAGDAVPADGVILSGRLLVDQSALNGESREVEKAPGRPKLGATLRLDDRVRVFRGSLVAAGDGIMRCESVGDDTFYGSMAGELQNSVGESPMKTRLSVLAGTLSRLGISAALLVTVADILNFIMAKGLSGWSLHEFTSDIIHALTLGITVIVVAVPEGLPMMITVVLSSNMLRMQRDHVMVRRLVGIETAGSMNILFTDKTGTLTRGELEAVCFIDAFGKKYGSPQDIPSGILRFLELNSALNTGSGNSTDRALRGYIGENEHNCRLLSGVRFGSEHKFSSADIEDSGSRYTLIKGAPERIISACRYGISADGKLTAPQMDEVNARWGELTRGAYRVIAIAISREAVKESGGFGELTFVGLIGIRDELRKEAKHSVEAIYRAGIKPVMVTGDNRETAYAIARECGIICDKRESRYSVVTGDELSKLSDERLSELLPEISVVARALPSDKSRLVKLAQKRGMICGMTGDGINDSPALRLADVGFAMGSGAEIAKEAGDIVITENNIASIVRAILYGRTIFKSIRKFIVFQLTMNLCAVGISVIGPFIGVDTPVTVMQMLWINIIMDTLAGIAFAGEPPREEYLSEQPKSREERVLNTQMLCQIGVMGIYTIGLCIFFLKSPLIASIFRKAPDDIYLMTGFFALFIFCGVFNCINARTHRLNLLSRISGNLSFIAVISLIVFVQTALIYLGGDFFRTAGLTSAELKTVMLLALSVIPVDLIRKLLLRVLRLKREY